MDMPASSVHDSPVHSRECFVNERGIVQICYCNANEVEKQSNGYALTDSVNAYSPISLPLLVDNDANGQRQLMPTAYNSLYHDYMQQPAKRSLQKKTNDSCNLARDGDSTVLQVSTPRDNGCFESALQKLTLPETKYSPVQLNNNTGTHVKPQIGAKRHHASSSQLTHQFLHDTFAGNNDRSAVLDSGNMDFCPVYTAYDHKLSPPSLCSPQSTSPFSSHTAKQEACDALTDGSISQPAAGVYLEQPRLLIVEQPVSRLRFRYESERGAHGSNKQCPKVKVENFVGEGYVKAKLYTCEAVPRKHVNRLWGNKDCNSATGVAKLVLDDNMTAQLKNLGILRVKEPDVAQLMHERFKGEHQERLVLDEAASMRNCLSQVCIGFKAYLTLKSGKQLKIGPVFSDPILNSHNPSHSNLKIAGLSRTVGSCLGNEEIWMRLTEKIKKDDVRIIFTESSTGWTKEAVQQDVYGQILVIFTTPPYHNFEIEEEAPVSVLLQRSSNNERSAEIEFVYQPQDLIPTKRSCQIDIKSDETDAFRRQQATLTQRGNNANNQASSSQPQQLHGFDLSQYQFQRNSALTADEQKADIATLRRQYEEEMLKSNAMFQKPMQRELPDGEHENRWTNINQGSSQQVFDLCSANYARDSGIGSEIISCDSRNSACLTEDPELLTAHSGKGANAADIPSLLESLSLSEMQYVGSNSALLHWCCRMMLARERNALEQYSQSGQPLSFLRLFAHQIGQQHSETGDTCLHSAVKQQQTEALKHLLEALEVLETSEKLAVVNTTNHKKQTALHIAVQLGDVGIIQDLLLHGTSIQGADRSGNTVFHIMALSSYDNVNLDDQLMILDALAKQNVDRLVTVINQKNYQGLTALHLSIQHKKIVLAKLLLDRGASPDVRDRCAGHSALHYAAKSSDSADTILPMLLARAESVDTKAYDGSTALHLAVAKRKYTAAALLIAAGANPLHSVTKTSGASLDVSDSDNDEAEADCNDPLHDDFTSEAMCNAFDLAQPDDTMVAILRGEGKQSSAAHMDVSSAEKNVCAFTAQSDHDLAATISVASIDTRTRLKLCRVLDSNDRWIDLAKSVNCEYMIDDIKCVTECSHAMLFLDQYELLNSSSIETLKAGLLAIGVIEGATLGEHVETLTKL